MMAAPEKWGLLGAADSERWGHSSSKWVEERWGRSTTSSAVCTCDYTSHVRKARADPLVAFLQIANIFVDERQIAV